MIKLTAYSGANAAKTALTASSLFGFSAAAAVLNVLLGSIMTRFTVPLFMDTLGTATVAILGGPVWGTLTAALTHLLFEVFSGFNLLYAPWVLCSTASAVIIGSLAGRNPDSLVIEFFLIILAVTFANALLGAVIHVTIYGGFSNHAADFIVQGFQLIIEKQFLAVFWARITVNLIDKSIALAVAYSVLHIVQNRIRTKFSNE